LFCPWSLLLRRLEQFFFVQGSMHQPEALLRANAEGAAGAVLLLPWGGSDAIEVPSAAADAGLVDANIMAAARHLRSLNPHMQVGE
jgi:hypothetical protein